MTGAAPIERPELSLKPSNITHSFFSGTTGVSPAHEREARKEVWLTSYTRWKLPWRVAGGTPAVPVAGFLLALLQLAKFFRNQISTEGT